MTGRRAPLDGMGRVRIAAPWADAVGGRKIEAAPAAARDESRARRLSVATRGVRMTIRRHSVRKTKEQVIASVARVRRDSAGNPTHRRFLDSLRRAARFLQDVDFS